MHVLLMMQQHGVYRQVADAVEEEKKAEIHARISELQVSGWSEFKRGSFAIRLCRHAKLCSEIDRASTHKPVIFFWCIAGVNKCIPRRSA